MSDWQGIFPVGMTSEQSFTVLEEHSAVHLGSGDLRVLATPWMITYMERTARDLLGQHLPQGSSSVGVHLDVHHLAATPVGAKVTARGGNQFGGGAPGAVPRAGQGCTGNFGRGQPYAGDY